MKTKCAICGREHKHQGTARACLRQIETRVMPITFLSSYRAYLGVRAYRRYFKALPAAPVKPTPPTVGDGK